MSTMTLLPLLPRSQASAAAAAVAPEDTCPDRYFQAPSVITDRQSIIVEALTVFDEPWHV
jgi:hypothetical protein